MGWREREGEKESGQVRGKERGREKGRGREIEGERERGGGG